jgi:hypothetical protein
MPAGAHASGAEGARPAPENGARVEVAAVLKSSLPALQVCAKTVASSARGTQQEALLGVGASLKKPSR